VPGWVLVDGLPLFHRVCLAASDDTAVFDGVWAGTNTGAFGPFAATGRSVSMPWANVLRFEPDGRIIDGTAYYDQLTAMIQLGHMEPPAEG
jgi:ketosteroid isomerase-like protein